MCGRDWWLGLVGFRLYRLPGGSLSMMEFVRVFDLIGGLGTSTLVLGDDRSLENSFGSDLLQVLGVGRLSGGFFSIAGVSSLIGVVVIAISVLLLSIGGVRRVGALKFDCCSKGLGVNMGMGLVMQVVEGSLSWIG